MTAKEEQRIADTYARIIRTVCVYYTEEPTAKKQAVACFNTAVEFMRACFPKTYIGKEYNNHVLNDIVRQYNINREEFIDFMLKKRW